MSLALICGTGALPKAVAQAQSDAPLICVLDGFAPEGLSADITFRLENLGSLLVQLNERGVTAVCLCGAIRRPIIDPEQIDIATVPFVPVLKDALGQGDDGALRAVIGIFEGAGFTLRAAHELAPSLLPETGVLTLTQPGPQARADVQEARLALAEMGQRDLGQACVIRNGTRIATETDSGTDAMLVSLIDTGPPKQKQGDDPVTWAMDTIGDMLDETANWLSNRTRPDGAKGGVMYKAPKPNQDRRADLPTIGLRTATAAIQAGLDGIVIEAGGVIVLDRKSVVQTLNEAGVFLWVRPE